MSFKYFLPVGMFMASMVATPAFATPPSTAASTPTETPEDTTNNSPEPEAPQSQSAGGASGMLNGLAHSAYLLGDMGGLRPLLGDYGATLNIVETSEILGNVSGGIKQGFVYDGLTQADLQVDTQRALGLYGGTFNVSALYIHGSNLSADNLGTLQTASGIEADRALRLWELWYQQKFDDGKVDVKIGEQSADQEFIVSSNAGLFVNTMFGWPVDPSYNLPGGGPAYPLSAPAVRLRFKPADSLTVLAAAFNSTPVLNENGDPQQQNPSGTSFPLGNGVLAFAELQYEFPANGAMVRPDDSRQLPGVYKLGMWYDSEKFADQEFDENGLSLANPASDSNPMQHKGDYSIYGVADQTIWRSSEPNEEEKSLNFFTRIMGSPDDSNLIRFGLNGGLTLKDPIEGRDDDTFGLGMGYVKVSNRAGNFDSDTAFFGGGPNLVRHTETFIEATYQYQFYPWLQLQPDFQYVFDPGAGASNPNNPVQKIGNEAVIGLRTNITF